MESFEVKGNWWLPWKQEEKVDGTLVFNPVQGGTITLEGSFQGCNLAEYNIVHGFAAEKDMTLRDYHERGIVPDLTDGSCQTIATVKQIFVGRHFETSNDILFDSLSFGSTHLNEWMLQPQTELSQNEMRDQSYVDFEIDLPKNADVLRFVFPQSWPQPRRDARIEITARNNLHFDHYNWHIVHLLNLLAVATGKPIFPRSISGERRESDDTVVVYFKVAGYDDTVATVSHRNMLLTFDDIQKARDAATDGVENQQSSQPATAVPNTLNTWIEKTNWLWEQTDLYVETIIHPTLHPKIKFLLLAQALESIHRNVGYKDKYIEPIDEEEFKSLARRLIDKIPNNVKDSDIGKRLIPEIKRANEYSLAARLEGLCAEVANHTDWDIEELLGAIQGENGFVASVKRARNDLSHYPKISRKKRNKIWKQGLKYIYEMQVLVRIALLLQLEMPAEHVQALLQRFRNNNSDFFGNHAMTYELEDSHQQGH